MDRLIRGFVLAVALLASSSAFAQKDLRDCMNQRYGAGQWTLHTGPNLGTDIAPAINLCLQDIRNTVGRSIISIPPGTWMMRTPINPALLSGNYIEGYGSQASRIVYGIGWGVAFHWSGAGGYTGGGMRGISLFLEQDLGDSNAYGIMLRGDAVSQPDQMEFSDIYMSALGTSYWWDNFHIDGTARAAPQGVRVGMVSNVQLFRARNFNMYLGNAVAWVFTGVGCWVSKGAYAHWFYIDSASVEISRRAVWCAGNPAP